MDGLTILCREFNEGKTRFTYRNIRTRDKSFVEDTNIVKAQVNLCHKFLTKSMERLMFTDKLGIPLQKNLLQKTQIN